MSASLLPPNATPLERALCDATKPALALPVERIKTLWDPWSCPAGTLPWLAWSLSVDDWDTNWTEPQKRSAIAASIQVHRVKGTVGALRRALAAVGYETSVQENTRGPYTFQISVNIGTREVDSPALIAEVVRIAERNKNVRSQLSGVSTYIETVGTIYISAVMLTGEIHTVFASIEKDIEVTCTTYIGITMLSSEVITIFPESATYAWSDGTPLCWPDGEPIAL